MKDISECVELYEELEDGSIDDIAGQGYWHLEKMKKGIFCLTIECDERTRTLFLSSEDGDIQVTTRD